MQRLGITFLSLGLLAGCAPFVHDGSLSQADQARIMQEVEASRNAAKNDFASFANVCLASFPDAHSLKNDGGNRFSEQWSVNIDLITGGRRVVCSVSRDTMTVERIHTGAHSMSLAEFKATKSETSLDSVVSAPPKAKTEPQISPATAKSAATTPERSGGDILMEACNNIIDSEKRLECLKAIPKAESSPSASAKAEAVRAFTDLRSILNAGTSFNSYSSQLESVVKAIGRFKSEAKSDSDRRSAALLDEALEAHKDALLFWQRDISWYARSSNSTAYPGGLPIEYTGTAYLVSKYGLKTQKSDFWGLSQGLPRAQTLRTIWQQANNKVDAALN